MQHIPYIPKYTSNQPFKNDFTQSFSLAFIIRKNALILYSFSEEKEVQNGLFYHFIYKTLVVNWSNMLHRKMMIIVCHFTLCPLFSSVIRRANNLLEALKYKKTKKYQLWQYIQYINERYRLSIQKLYLKLNA